MIFKDLVVGILTLFNLVNIIYFIFDYYGLFYVESHYRIEIVVDCVNQKYKNTKITKIQVVPIAKVNN